MATSVTPRMHLSPRVKHALETGSQPVVALESTIISHGMPFPANLDCARDVEQIIQNHGAVPATIAILNGNIHVGLEPAELESFARLPPSSVLKCSRRDVAVATGLGENGATTVSATMMLAHRCGIKLFVTGGIGGVHRQAFGGPQFGSSLDVSADLTELGRTPVTVVCAGVKSILDIGLTLEYLETQGVTVVTVPAESGEQQVMFPSFFTQRSKEVSPLSISNLADVAKIVHANGRYGIDSGVLVAVPNPNPADEEEIEEAIRKALEELEGNSQVSGKDVTPFLLQRVNEVTRGDSLEANMALVKNNAKVGAQIAVLLHSMGNGSSSSLP